MGEWSFPVVSSCSYGEHRSGQTVVADLDGTLLRGRSSFPYFFLVAFEAGSYIRSLVLLLMVPVIGLLNLFVSEAAGMHLMIWISYVGLKVKDIEGVSRAVLIKFYVDDLHSETWRAFSTFGRRVVITANPRVMVEPFLKEMLGVDEVVGTEIEVSRFGRATGFLCKPGVLVGAHKEQALKRWSMCRGTSPQVGIGNRPTDFPFMSLCKEGYVVPATRVEPVRKLDLPKQVIFHDGRLVQRPTPLNALKVLAWMPVGVMLSFVRVMSGSWLPLRYVPLAYKLTGVKLVIKGNIPSKPLPGDAGILYICNHRTLLDPVTVAIALRRPIPAVTYSISSVSEMLSPLPTIALSRDREKDSANMRQVLCKQGELTLCPEGTTCREAFLLRFSALFAELSDRIIPVAVKTTTNMFHGTTARGNKAMDPFFCQMNPRPVYEIHFLNEVPRELTCAGGKSSFEVANYIQRLLAGTLGYECTPFTRKDKYRLLAGNDGIVPAKVVNTTTSNME